MNYAICTNGETVDVYRTRQRAEARAKAIAGCIDPSEARPLAPSTVEQFLALSGYRHMNESDTDGPVWVVPTNDAVTDD